ncbi:LexA-binding, inner membrane-associated putative hydrolase [uncultured archaeon]|nr:LexA-binding, inner membrane-associated putative hydrolase [uncultured archaeon]
MNWPAHAAVGAISGLALALLLGLNATAALLPVALCAFSALVPDIDHGESKIRQITDAAALLFAVFLAVVSTCPQLNCAAGVWKTAAIYCLAVFGLYAIVMAYIMPNHRGIIHSLLFAAIYAVVVLLLSDWQLAIFATVGYCSHLAADKEIKIV